MSRLRLLAIAALALLVAGAAVLTWQLAHRETTPSVRPELADDGRYRAGSVPAHSRAAVQAAVDAVPPALSYDHAHLDQSLTAATSRMTADFAEEFRNTFDATVRPLAEKEDAVSQARVRAAGLVEESGGAVQVMVYVDQVLVSSKAMTEGQKPVKVGQTRVLLRMVRVGKAWKVDDLRPL